jgi:uncharacterized protein HemY
MALDDPIVWILIIALALIPIYLLSLLVRFLLKANKFMDEYNKRKNEQQAQEAQR